tara:strand:+ start:957 stop:1202 length:246 start_codon:yes stop_codon:yes gene_type:complete
MRECSKTCLKWNEPCPKENSACRYWIDYGDDLNCTFIAIDNNGPMTLRDVAKREGISHVRVSQIEDKLLPMLRRKLKDYAP